MAESIGMRVRRLVGGGINALVDAMEGAAPEVVMEQSLRDIDQAIGEIQQELGRTLAARHQAHRRHGAESAEHGRLEARLQVALDEGREDLAEAAVSRQLDIEAQLPVLETAIAEYTERESELGGYIAALKARRRELARELADFRDARRRAPGGDDGASRAGRRADIAEAAFRRAMGDAGGESAAGADPARAARLAELEDLSRRNRVRERLEAIRARRGR